MVVMEDTKYQAGESYADNKAVQTGFIEDLKAIGIKDARGTLDTIMEVIQGAGKPLDDKKFTTEELIAIMTKLPSDSKLRSMATNKLIDKLWSNLQHPPLSYMGGDCTYQATGNDKKKSVKPSSDTIKYQSPNGCEITQSVPEPPSGIFKYRTPDGSYNNILHPNIGRAGTPYAKSVLSAKKLQGVRPDPGVLFDLLMGRREDSFKENPAGISSILFYHASIIIHDIFRTNRFDKNISDTSSYLDLAPLYGSSLQDQLEIRTMEKGMLKPDTFHERRLMGQPPGINVILIMYSRFHNYCADILLKINEGDRFTLGSFTNKEEEAEALAKQDNDLFNTARLIVGGMYINISLHDYLRAITNTHHSKSDWTLDPRVEIGKTFGSDGVPRGIGNQVSVEFNLLYRFHSAISKRDEKWTNDFLAGLFPDKKSIDELTPWDLQKGLLAFEQNINPDPSKREFGGLKRQADGKFKDDELVKVLKESIEDPAGMFGARMVPKALKVVERLGILQARKWQVASLNEFRDFFGLKRHETMEDINDDPEIAEILRNLYTHPDMVELYPGLFIESVKPRMDTGCGICPPYSVGRAILSDAITLVRSDRFYTIDYTASTLTNWGMQEVQFDNKTLGGSMFYKLIQRGVPGWFPFNSLHVMQPMYTPKMNAEIATEIKTIQLYTHDDPATPRDKISISSLTGCKTVLDDKATFLAPSLSALNDIFPAEKDHTNLMLQGHQIVKSAQASLLGKAVKDPTAIQSLLSNFIADRGALLLRKNAFTMSKDWLQIDVIRDIALPLNARLLGDLFYLNINSAENPDSTLESSGLYKALADVRTWCFNNNDPGQAWNRRRWATDGAKLLRETSTELINAVAAERNPRSRIETFFLGKQHQPSSSLKKGSLRSYGHGLAAKLLADGNSVDKVVDLLWLSAVSGTGILLTSFVEVLNLFLSKDYAPQWAKIQELAAAKTAKADDTIRAYVAEAKRLTSLRRTLRRATKDTTIDKVSVKKGDVVACQVGVAGRGEDAIGDIKCFDPTRVQTTVWSSSFAPFESIDDDIALTFVAGLIKLVAGLKNLRPAPGDMGVLKSIEVKGDKCFLSDSWSYLTYDPSTWKLHYDGYGQGVYTPPKVPVTEGQNLRDIDNGLKRKADEEVSKIHW